MKRKKSLSKLIFDLAMQIFIVIILFDKEK